MTAGSENAAHGEAGKPDGYGGSGVTFSDGWRSSAADVAFAASAFGILQTLDGLKLERSVASRCC